jgi:hypothetical protein
LLVVLLACAQTWALESAEARLFQMFVEPDTEAANDVPGGFFERLRSFRQSEQFRSLDRKSLKPSHDALYQFVIDAAESGDQFRELLAFYGPNMRDVWSAREKLRVAGNKLSTAMPKTADALRQFAHQGAGPYFPGQFNEHKQREFSAAWGLMLLMPDCEERAKTWRVAISIISGIDPERGNLICRILLVRSAKRGDESKTVQSLPVGMNEPSFLYFRMLFAAGKNSGGSIGEVRRMLNEMKVHEIRGEKIDHWLRRETVSFLNQVARDGLGTKRDAVVQGIKETATSSEDPAFKELLSKVLADYQKAPAAR